MRPRHTDLTRRPRSKAPLQGPESVPSVLNQGQILGIERCVEGDVIRNKPVAVMTKDAYKGNSFHVILSHEVDFLALS